MRAHAVISLLFGILTLPAAAFQGAGAEPRQSGKYDPAGRAKASELLEKSWRASGSERALQQVASLSVSMNLRRHISYISVESPETAKQKEKILSGKISIEMQFPDKFRKKVSTSTLSGNKYSYFEVVNGDRAWRDPPLQAASSRRDPKVIDVGDFERSLSYQEQGARQQFSYYTLAWFSRNLPGDPVKFNLDDRMQVNDESADILIIEGLTDPPLRFLLDRNTHLPLGFDSIVRTALAPRVIVEGNVFGRGEVERMLEKAREVRKAQMKPPRQVTIQTRFSDRRRVGGILIPFHMTTSIEGKIYEELFITKIEINHHLNPQDFEQKPRKR